MRKEGFRGGLEAKIACIGRQKIVLLHRWGNTKDMTSGAQSSVASQDLWIWHSLFGMAGSYNNINVL
jgi:hypothetical protein